MEIKNKSYKVVTPKEGMWLYNESERIISDKVYMPDGADVSVWKEITDAKSKNLKHNGRRKCKRKWRWSMLMNSDAMNVNFFILTGYLYTQ